MDVMQDSAKRDLEGTEVEKSLPRQLRPVPGSVFQPGGQLLTLCFERHHDPQCFVQIEIPLPDWPFAGLAFRLSIVVWKALGQRPRSLS
jgi:hypothetical protein